ncbi:MAG TPA: signal peptidase I [Acidimicrobiales bacterium]|nr:signal peptidase I [Acidimicrobiales bacterium]
MHSTAERRGAHAAPQRRHHPARGAIEWLIIVLVAVVLAVVIRTWVFESYTVPSGSMTPTIQINDRILVDKLSYSFGSPHIGQIVVFHKAPTDPADTPILVKRLIAVPGDTVRSGPDGEVFVNNHLLREPWLSTSARNDPGPRICSSGNPGEVPAATEYCHGRILRLPKGEYWMMGDNRGDSSDSRYWGPVPRRLLIGHVVARMWPPRQWHVFGALLADR